MPPWLVLAAIVSLTLALLYQVSTRRVGWRVLLYWLVILVAFVGAEGFAESAGWNITRFGDLRLLPDLAAAFVVLALLWVLDW